MTLDAVGSADVPDAIVAALAWFAGAVDRESEAVGGCPVDGGIGWHESVVVGLIQLDRLPASLTLSVVNPAQGGCVAAWAGFQGYVPIFTVDDSLLAW